MVDTHKATLAQATKQLRRLSPGPDLDIIRNSLTKYPLGLSTFKKLLQLKNKMLQVQYTLHMYMKQSTVNRPTLAEEPKVVGDDLLAVATGETEYICTAVHKTGFFLQLPEVMPEVIPELPGLSSRDIDVYSEVLPSLLQYGGDMLTYHVNSVMSR